MNKIWSLIRKEWAEVFKNRVVLMVTILVPLLFAVLPLAILNGLNSPDGGGAGLQDIPTEFMPACGELVGVECFQFYILTQFLALFMIIPIMIPVTIASYSIVGEKRTRTLEPLLATPITTTELLLGKSLAAAIPALLATFGAFLIFAGGTNLMLDSSEVAGQMFAPLWLLAIFVLGPLFSIAGVSLAIMVSSRVNDPRVAEQISSLVILPIAAIFISQSVGLFQLNAQIILYFSLALSVIDMVLIYFATQLFQRENILTRWN
jgi:ABC-2 type transport system permease protein